MRESVGEGSHHIPANELSKGLSDADPLPSQERPIAQGVPFLARWS